MSERAPLLATDKASFHDASPWPTRINSTVSRASRDHPSFSRLLSKIQHVPSREDKGGNGKSRGGWRGTRTGCGERKKERWWKNRGSRRKKKKSTKRERKRGKKREERKREVRCRTQPSTERLTIPSSSSSIEDTLRLSVPSYVLALAHRPSLYSRTFTYSHIQARTESRSHPPAARGPVRPTPSRQPSLGRRVPALSVFPRPVPTTPFHAVSRRACPYTPPACNCPLYRL